MEPVSLTVITIAMRKVVTVAAAAIVARTVLVAKIVIKISSLLKSLNALKISAVRKKEILVPYLH